MTEGVNRRQAVRVTDIVMLAAHPVSVEKIETIANDFRQGVSPYTQEGLADIQMFIGAQSALAKLRGRDSDLADFLQHLENKMNKVDRKLKRLIGKEISPESLVRRKANFSASGIAFCNDIAYKKDKFLELQFVLLPDYVYVYAFGKVVACDPVAQEQDPNCHFRIALEFVYLLDEDREKIIQHIFKQQSIALRNRSHNR